MELALGLGYVEPGSRSLGLVVELEFLVVGIRTIVVVVVVELGFLGRLVGIRMGFARFVATRSRIF